MGLVARVAEFARERALFPAGSTVAVAVSGGLDSVVLLDVLLRLQRSFGLRLVVATVDHGRRGMAGVEDTDLVRRLATARGLPIYCGRITVPPGAGFEEAARRERLAFLAGVPADRVALGHHRDDRAETVLLRLLRGAGLDGLAAMAPCRLPFVRPLIQEPRAVLLSHALERGLSWREDSTNAALVHERNRVRHRVLPVLETVHGGVADRLASMADVLEADVALLRELETAARARVAVDGGLDRAALLREPPALQARLLRSLVAAGAAAVPGARLVQDAVRLAGRGRGVLEVPWGHRLVVDRDRVRCLPPPPATRPLRPGSQAWGLYRIQVEGDLPAGCLRVRPPRAGDRVQGRPLHEVLRSRGIPAGLRPYHPLICRADDPSASPLWVPGWSLPLPLDPGRGPAMRLTITSIAPGGCPGSPWCTGL